MASGLSELDLTPNLTRNTTPSSSLSNAPNDVLASANEYPSDLASDVTAVKHENQAIEANGSSSYFLSETVKPKFLPIPIATGGHGNSSQTSFILSDSGDVLTTGEGEALPYQIATADVSIATDGSYVQTSSALAARELKKCYDRILGVGQGPQGLIRSPYVISSYPDELGTSVFRIEKIDRRSENAFADSSPSHTTGSRRKSRLSVHDFLPTNMFKPTENGSLPRINSSTSVVTGSTPPSHTISTPPHQGRRKLRKTRSNSDLHLRGAYSPHGTSTGENSGHLSPPPRSETFSIEIRDEVTAGADAFSQVLGWASELATEPVLSSRKVKMSVTSIAEDTSELSNANGVNAERPTKSRRPSISTSAALNSLNMDINVTPFGDNVRYVSPLQHSATMLDSQRPQLREMQSFESGLTARIGDDPGAPSTPKSKGKNPEKDGKSESTLPDVFSQPRFATAVFDVLQTYRGLPLPSSLLSAPPMGATIKMSSTDSPNPKDDPRFVIWGEVQPVGASLDDGSISHSSYTDLSSSGPSVISGAGKRKRSNARSSDNTPKLVVDGDSSPPTVIIAGTIERWIAQLTSELNYDELLNFLLTYRTYISPVDLCHLLICRFHWALEAPGSKQDDMVRRIVRLRTFIAIRYWLLTFFREDFLPNAELCQLFSSWINSLIKDPILKRLPDALSIVRKLRKVVRECKVAYFRPGRSTGRLSADLTQKVLGESGVGGGNGAENDDSDVDLDFSSMKGHTYNDVMVASGLMNIPITAGNNSHPQSTLAYRPQEGPAALPTTNSILLSQPLSKTILGHVKSAKSGTDIVSTQTTATLPAQHSAISRAFVNTIGKLGRWKRVLNARAPVPSPHCGDVSAFDLEPNAAGDLFIVPGGVEGYLKMLNVSPQILPGSNQSEDIAVPPADVNPICPPGLELTGEHTAINPGQSKAPAQSIRFDEFDDPAQDKEAKSTSNPSDHARESVASSLTDPDISDHNAQSNSEMVPPPGWSPEIVSLDDYDLSDSDCSSESPTAIRKLPRRLPNRRDFQFVRRSIASVSSMGIRSQSSFGSSIKSSSASTSARSHGSAESGGRPLVSGHFEQWQIELISDDEDEAGDAEAALRRLEGQIDLDRQREKDIKVGRWLKTASRRAGRNDSVSSTQSRRRFSDQAEEEGEEEEREEEELSVAQTPQDNEDVALSMDPAHMFKRPIGVLSMKEANPASDNLPLDPASSIPTTSHPPVNGNSQTDRPSERASTESLESNQASMHSIPESFSGIARRPSLMNKGSRQPPPSAFGSSNVPRPHRSFILMHKSETLAQQFAIIEAELFAKIKFEELISHQWGQTLEDVDVRDWVQFVKERARLKNMGKPPSDHNTASKLSAILVLRARFDLLVNFTASEILLAYPNERVLLVEKFIRIAWKAYLHNNFNTLVSLISGLQTRWVNQAMARHWHKVGMWEQRIFEDLKRFASRTEQFRFIRNATTTLIDARPLQSGPQDNLNASTIVSSSASKSKTFELRNAPSACVPFLGVYLAQLYEYEKLPDFIDPTAPAKPVLIDSDSGMLSSPAHPEVFFNLQPLPQELSLEPLINVQKQRLIASVIKSFVAGQHLATNVPFEVDQKCYQKCYRLRSLGPEALYGVARSLAEQ